MYFIIYETANNLNGKRYRGAHVCETLEDNYLGSGLLLKKAIAKYGHENFSRTILEICSSVEEMFLAEAKYVDKSWVEDPTTYNLKIGGEGGWDYINKSGLRWSEEKKNLHSIEMKKKRSVGEWGPKSPTFGMLGKKHSAQSKEKISKNSASKLPQEEVENRKIDIINSEYPKRGSVKVLSNLWGVSHTQVKRFIESI